MENSAGFLFPLLTLAFAVFFLAGFWKTFTKAGHPGWACLVPIYNVIVLLQIAGRPMWWLLLMFLPFVNFFVALILTMDIARNFGKGVGFGLGLFFLGPIFYAILGFGDAQYAPSH